MLRAALIDLQKKLNANRAIVCVTTFEHTMEFSHILMWNEDIAFKRPGSFFY